MEGIEIPDEQVVAMEQVAPGVHGLRIVFVNVFGVSHAGGGWTLIDAGVPFSAGRIKSWAEEMYGGRPPRAIVLTHGHFDHVSAAGELAEGWDVPVYAHPEEFPYLTGEKEYPAPNSGAGGGAMSLLSPTYPRGPVNLVGRLRALPLTEGPLDVLPGWELLHTPGHTPGHVSFYNPSERILLPGDAFCTTKPESFFDSAVMQPAELHGPPSYFTSDWDAARTSVQRLAAFDVDVVAPGHGQPLAGEHVAQALRELAARFDEVAVPENVKG